VTRIADAFTWPFRARASSWLAGVIAVLLLPLLFIPLLGYAVAATRVAANDAAHGPPAWPFSWRLLTDGFWTALVIALTAAPFAIAFVLLTRALHGPIADVVVFFALVLAWGLVALLFLPHATAAFATTGSARDMFDFSASVRGVRRDFATWNVAVAAIVTGWAIGLACAGLLCVGLVPGIFYAILVSAHATAALSHTGAREDPSSR
jgi:uncharacterized protein DUF4013